ncbi:hypothetical protein [Methyloprofundus sp.]|uniref:hypothetical protein n=1 Tax=Methyloprofundus sp. TaxID=2020875 RepID=UPI003D1185DE
MKTPLIISILSVTLTLIPNISFANSDNSQYPAANFQPKIVFQDEQAKNASSSTKSTGEKSAYDPDYPASSFAAKILYQDKDAIKTSINSAPQGERSVFDPKYPAANFEPKVIYP